MSAVLRRAAMAFFILLAPAPAFGEPIEPSDVRVLDGDTVEARGRAVRLVGFDTPETDRAQCAAERVLGNRAAVRLRQLIASGALDLALVPCNCRPGTEGTRACNYGRACGVLTIGGYDVGRTLIAEGLARSYVCRGDRCPRRRGWC
jgi:endonuclease YncB( thermonuclease family)